MKIKTLILTFLLATSYGFAGNPDTGDKHKEASHWSASAGLGNGYNGLGLQIRKSVGVGEDMRAAGWLSFGLLAEPAWGGGIDFYLYQNLYLSLGYGTIGTYDITTFNPDLIRFETETFNLRGFSALVNVDWYAVNDFALTAGLGVQMNDNYASGDLGLAINLGIKYAF